MLDSRAKIRQNYNSAKFTIAEYEKLLALAKTGFRFCNYREYKSIPRAILWRHDIDLSLEQALVMAKIEQNQAVVATYFIHLHNDFYNALDISSSGLIRGIIACGHDIGLHFDFAYYDINSVEQLVHWLEFEKSIIENIFQKKVSVFSFHNTNDYSMSFAEEEYAGMINTYSGWFKEQVHYCSDSNGYWRFERLCDVLSNPDIQQLQVLTHPGWWTEEELLPRDKIIKHIDRRRENTLNLYDKTLELSDRINIGK